MEELSGDGTVCGIKTSEVEIGKLQYLYRPEAESGDHDDISHGPRQPPAKHFLVSEKRDLRSLSIKNGRATCIKQMISLSRSGVNLILMALKCGYGIVNNDAGQPQISGRNKKV